MEVGDARDLSILEADSFDAVLCLGPLYHLHHQEDRDKVVRECIRILRKSGIAFFAFISKYGPITDTVKMRPEAISRQAPLLLNFIETGVQVVDQSSSGWTDAYFVDPMLIDRIMEPFPLKKRGLYGLEGMVAQSEDRIYQLGEEVTAAWVDFIYQTAQEPSIAASSEHILYVGRK